MLIPFLIGAALLAALSSGKKKKKATAVAVAEDLKTAIGAATTMTDEEVKALSHAQFDKLWPKLPVSESTIDPKLWAALHDEVFPILASVGWKPSIFEGARTPARAAAEKQAGRSKLGAKSEHVDPDGDARATAVDIIDSRHGWEGAEAEKFFDDLATAVESVGLVSGHRWRWRDSAHVELP